MAGAHTAAGEAQELDEFGIELRTKEVPKPMEVGGCQGFYPLSYLGASFLPPENPPPSMEGPFVAGSPFQGNFMMGNHF